MIARVSSTAWCFQVAVIFICHGVIIMISQIFPTMDLHGKFQHKGIVGLNHTASRKEKELVSIVTHQLSSLQMHFGLCSQMNCALVVIKSAAFELVMIHSHMHHRIFISIISNITFFFFKCPYYGFLKMSFHAVCNTALSEWKHPAVLNLKAHRV